MFMKAKIAEEPESFETSQDKYAINTGVFREERVKLDVMLELGKKKMQKAEDSEENQGLFDRKNFQHNTPQAKTSGFKDNNEEEDDV